MLFQPVLDDRKTVTKSQGQEALEMLILFMTVSADDSLHKLLCIIHVLYIHFRTGSWLAT